MSWKANIGYLFWVAVLLIIGAATASYGVGFILIFIAVILLIIAALRVKSSEYLVTSHRVFAKYGLVSRRVFEIKNEWITGAIVNQGFLARALNYGDVVLSTPGQFAGSVVLVGVSDPMRVRTIVEDALKRYREYKEVEQELKELEREYELGRMDKARYEELKAKYEERLKKAL